MKVAAQAFLLWNERVKVKPNNRKEAGRVCRERRALFHDSLFWFALLAGVTVCWLWAVLLGRSGELTMPWAQWRQILWLVVLYPALEEWVFRGGLQPWLLARRYGAMACCGISMANGVTTVLFAGFHLIAHAPVWAMLVIAPSLIYGSFRDRYRSIFPGTLLHSSYNLVYFSLFGLPVS